MASSQTAFNTPVERSEEVIERASNNHDADHVTLAVSGGTDSVVAADVMCRVGPKYGLSPDSVTHINTGAAIPQSRLCAKIVAEMHDLEFKEQGYRNEQDSIAYRILGEGWPGGYAGSPWTGGHGLEWANRKDKPMNEVYVNIDGQQIWVSGARKLESKKRQGNVPDSGVESDKPRRTWLSPIMGCTSAEKKEYIKDRHLPVSEAYMILGFSGECVACSFDEVGLLDNIRLLCPELAYCIEQLTVWLYMRVKRGDVDLDPKRLCWGWDVNEEPEDDGQVTFDVPTSQNMVGCDEDSCQTREHPSWVMDLPDSQIVDRNDVVTDWDGEFGKVLERFA